MNKTAIKNFAIWARVNLIESAKQRAYEYEITDGGQNNPNAEIIAGRPLSRNEQNQRKQLIEQVKRKGFDQVMEEAAYTWFNRFVALRYMEVNGYIPTRIRVFTNEDGEFKPEVLKEAMTVELDGLDREKVLDLLDKQDNESLYKMLLIAQCNSLSTGLPYIFEKIANWTELLFPSNLLKSDSIIGKMISLIPEVDWSDEVEIIGWLYQYYISEKHEEVVDPLHGQAMKKEDIPAATQLFTTDWVVKYIVDNSLGRYWIEGHSDSSLKEKLSYYIPTNETEKINVNHHNEPEQIHVFDPCVGSGHFLVYAFDVLIEIYRECGWSDRDAAKSIVENNLYGLDIDDRAVQLACFAVMMKARKYNRRILSGDVEPHIQALQDADCITRDLVTYVAGNDAQIARDLHELKKTFENAKEYGSLLSAPSVNYYALFERLTELKNAFVDNLIDMQYQKITESELLEIVKQADILSRKYEIVVTNPPYMNKYSDHLKEFLTSYFKAYSGDLFSAFMYRNFSFCTDDGYSGFMTPSTWMAAKQYESLREYIYDYKSISSFVQMAKGAFFKEATVDVCAFVLVNNALNKKGIYIRLDNFKGDMDFQNQKVLEALQMNDCPYMYSVSTQNYYAIPGKPIAFWISLEGLSAFERGTVGTIAVTKQGFKTGNNDLFLRLWHEVDISGLFLGTAKEEKRWFPCNKGGNYRKWYGNKEYVVDWKDDGYQIINYRDKKGKQLSRPQNIAFNFREALTWSTLSSGPISFRYSDSNMMFESKGSECFVMDPTVDIFGLQGYLNSGVCMYYLSALAPTVDYSEGSILKLPYIKCNDSRMLEIVRENVALSKKDWDSEETSWNFTSHPLVPETISVLECSYTIKALFSTWKKQCEERFYRMKANEEELNRFFIKLYGLGNELDPEVEDKNITVRLSNLQTDIKSMISYAVGCMFGRYSLDIEGLTYAGGDWDASKYHSVIPDADNIIPICDDEYFEDDIVGRFIKFVEKAYGEETLEENLKFVADALGGSGTPREVIRKYFLSDFYADHLKIYQKRPIYWLFDSGKKNGFKCLIYMHRYQSDTIARIRTDYIHELQSRYRTAIADLEDRVEHAAASERVKLSKQLAKIKDQELELRKYEEKIHHLADQMIEIDLDDGVKVNYAKFGDVLAKIK